MINRNSRARETLDIHNWKEAIETRIRLAEERLAFLEAQRDVLAGTANVDEEDGFSDSK